MILFKGKWKILLGTGMQFAWPISKMFVLLPAWLLLHWRRTMQVIIKTSTCLVTSALEKNYAGNHRIYVLLPAWLLLHLRRAMQVIIGYLYYLSSYFYTREELCR